MSSKRKDARWSHALTHIEDLGLEYDDMSWSGFQKFLDRAERAFEEYPDQVDWWYDSWQIRKEAEKHEDAHNY